MRGEIAQAVPRKFFQAGDERAAIIGAFGEIIGLILEFPTQIIHDKSCYF